MPVLPTGTITFLFTDIQGSTRLWEAYPRRMREILKTHDSNLRESIERNSGFVFKTVGDAFCAAFDTALDGVNAAVAAQLALNAADWNIPEPVRVRMALHTGEAEERDRDYFGPALSRVARLESIGYGGQTLVSLVTAELVRDTLPERVELKALGDRRLRDLTRPETIFQLMHPDIPSEFPPLKSLDQHPHNLPIQPTPLLGRERELSAIRKLLLDEKVRLVTLTGPGGMGKTRLALQSAADMIEQYEHGAFFVDLSQIRDPALLVPTIAQTLKLGESGTRSLQEVLKSFLYDRHMLLILDNFEQIPKAEPHVVELLSVCPRLQILVTSRESLHVREERVLVVPALAVPEHTSLGLPSLERLTQYDTVRLFIDRAVAIRQDFRITNDNAPAVAEICVRLDGIPLAIELAAARIRLLSPQAILKRLEHRMRLLSAGARDLPARQQTLRATIDWSYDLLDEAHMKLFRDLAVFEGGFTLDAAEAVCSEAVTEIDVLDGIESLLDKSMLLQEELEEGEPRFHMLETIREYALDRLEEASEGDGPRARHAAHFYAVAENGCPRLESEDQVAVLDTCDREIGNLRAALSWFEREQADECLQLAVFLWRFWRFRGFLTEGRTRLIKALESEPRTESIWRARALIGAGVLAQLQFDHDESKRLLGECLKLSEKLKDKALRTEALHELGWTHHRLNELDQARTCFQKCRVEAEELNDELWFAKATHGIGCVDWREGKTDEAEASIEASHRVFSKLSIPRLEALAIGNLGMIHHQRQDFDKARDCTTRAIAIFEEIGEKDTIKTYTYNLASVFQTLGEPENAIRYYEQLLDLSAETGDSLYLSAANAGLSEIRLAQGEIETAFGLAGKAYETVKDWNRGAVGGLSCRVMGDVLLAKGDRSKAQQFFEDSIHLLEEAGEQEELEKARQGYERARD